MSFCPFSSLIKELEQEQTPECGLQLLWITREVVRVLGVKNRSHTHRIKALTYRSLRGSISASPEDWGLRRPRAERGRSGRSEYGSSLYAAAHAYALGRRYHLSPSLPPLCCTAAWSPCLPVPVYFHLCVCGWVSGCTGVKKTGSSRGISRWGAYIWTLHLLSLPSTFISLLSSEPNPFSAPILSHSPSCQSHHLCRLLSHLSGLHPPLLPIYRCLYLSISLSLSPRLSHPLLLCCWRSSPRVTNTSVCCDDKHLLILRWCHTKTVKTYFSLWIRSFCCPNLQVHPINSSKLCEAFWNISLK